MLLLYVVCNVTELFRFNTYYHRKKKILYSVLLCYECFRDTLKRNYNLGQYFLDIDLGDLTSFDETLAEKLQKQPTEHLPIVSSFALSVDGMVIAGT